MISKAENTYCKEKAGLNFYKFAALHTIIRIFSFFVKPSLIELETSRTVILPTAVSARALGRRIRTSTFGVARRRRVFVLMTTKPPFIRPTRFIKLFSLSSVVRLRVWYCVHGP